MKAKTHWVWTEKAEKANPSRSRAGEVIWPHYAIDAPDEWVDNGLIIDSSKFVKEGQIDLLDLM